MNLDKYCIVSLTLKAEFTETGSRIVLTKDWKVGEWGDVGARPGCSTNNAPFYYIIFYYKIISL